jgi:hypothetical protein
VRINVSVDTSALKGRLRDIANKQIPFAKANAINEVAKLVQAEERTHIAKVFNVRRKQWVDMSVKITHFAKKQPGRTYAEVAIAPPGPRGKADILAKFEEGGIKTPRGKSIAIPDSVKRSKADIVTKGNRPKAFNFKLIGKGPKAEVFKGDRRTFLIRRADGTGAIYQRYGGKRTRDRDHASGRFSVSSSRAKDSNVRVLFTLTKDARIDKRLKFKAIAHKVIATRWGQEFKKAWDNAIRTAK